MLYSAYSARLCTLPFPLCPTLSFVQVFADHHNSLVQYILSPSISWGSSMHALLLHAANQQSVPQKPVTHTSMHAAGCRSYDVEEMSGACSVLQAAAQMQKETSRGEAYGHGKAPTREQSGW